MQTSFGDPKEEGRREEKKEQSSSNEKLPIGHDVLTHRNQNAMAERTKGRETQPCQGVFC